MNADDGDPRNDVRDQFTEMVNARIGVLTEAIAIKDRTIASQADEIARLRDLDVKKHYELIGALTAKENAEDDVETEVAACGALTEIIAELRSELSAVREQLRADVKRGAAFAQLVDDLIRLCPERGIKGIYPKRLEELLGYLIDHTRFDATLPPLPAIEMKP